MGNLERYAVEEGKDQQLMEAAFSETVADAAAEGYEALEKRAADTCKSIAEETRSQQMAEEAFAKTVAKAAEEGYETVEKGTVSTYKSIEDAVVGAYQKTEDFFVEKFLTRPGESVEDAKKRMQESVRK